MDLGLAVLMVKREEIPGQAMFDDMETLAPPPKPKRKQNAREAEKEARPWSRAYRPQKPPPCEMCAEVVVEKLKAGERTKAPKHASHHVSDGKVTRALCYFHTEEERQRLGLGKMTK